MKSSRGKWRKSNPNELKCNWSFDKFAKRATSFFWALFLLLVGSRPKKSMPIEKIGQFFAGFFHNSKIRKTASQLNRTGTQKPGKKKTAYVILFTHGRAYINILFKAAQ